MPSRPEDAATPSLAAAQRTGAGRLHAGLQGLALPAPAPEAADGGGAREGTAGKAKEAPRTGEEGRSLGLSLRVNPPRAFRFAAEGRNAVRLFRQARPLDFAGRNRQGQQLRHRWQPRTVGCRGGRAAGAIAGHGVPVGHRASRSPAQRPGQDVRRRPVSARVSPAGRCRGRHRRAAADGEGLSPSLPRRANAVLPVSLRRPGAFSGSVWLSEIARFRSRSPQPGDDRSASDGFLLPGPLLATGRRTPLPGRGLL